MTRLLEIATVLTLLIFLASPVRAAVPASATVYYSFAGGQEGAPMESFLIQHYDTQHEVTLMHALPHKKSTQETFELSDSEFKRLWAAVEQGDLLHFKPDDQGRVAFGWGDATLHMEVKTSRNAKTTRMDARWRRPVDNASRLTGMLKVMGQLSKLHAKKLHLEILRTDGK